MSEIEITNKPLVSVLMVTYNHEAFIKDAIEGVLAQKTNFSFELIVADDASTDRNQQIIVEYKNCYPNIIKPILRTKNIGGNKNWLDAFNHCRGEYIALCEGDDYWTDPLKLQKQTDFLVSNPTFSICHHRVKYLYKDKFYEHFIDIFKIKAENYFPKPISSLEDLAYRNFIQTPTVLFRKDVLMQKEIIDESLVGDYILFLLLAQYGPIKYYNDSMSVYRIHEGGAWSVKTTEYRKINMVDYLEKITGKFNLEINNIFIERHSNLCWDLFDSYSQKNNIEKANYYLKRGLLFDSKDFNNKILNMKRKYDLVKKFPFYSTLSQILKKFSNRGKRYL